MRRMRFEETWNGWKSRDGGLLEKRLAQAPVRRAPLDEALDLCGEAQHFLGWESPAFFPYCE